MAGLEWMDFHCGIREQPFSFPCFVFCVRLLFTSGAARVICLLLLFSCVLQAFSFLLSFLPRRRFFFFFAASKKRAEKEKKEEKKEAQKGMSREEMTKQEKQPKRKKKEK